MWVGVGELIPGKQSVPFHNGRAGNRGTWTGHGTVQNFLGKTCKNGAGRCGLASVCGVYIYI